MTAKMASLSNALKELNSFHASWVTKAGLDSTQLSQEQYNAQWLEDEWVAVDDLQTKVDDVVEGNLPAPCSDAQKLEILSAKFETLKISITSKTIKIKIKIKKFFFSQNHVIQSRKKIN